MTHNNEGDEFHEMILDKESNYIKHIENNWGKNPVVGSKNDSLLIISVFIDSNKYVHWNLLNLYGYGFEKFTEIEVEGFEPIRWENIDKYFVEYMNQIEYFYEFFSEDDTPDKIEARTPKEKRTFVPQFKTYLRNNTIEYEVYFEDGLNKFLTLPLTSTDTVHHLPKFISVFNETKISLYNVDLYYNGDTTFFYPRLEIELPCYKFISRKINYSENFEEFNFVFTEVIIEKASLLPVRIIQNISNRMSYNNNIKFSSRTIEIH